MINLYPAHSYCSRRPCIYLFAAVCRIKIVVIFEITLLSQTKTSKANGTEFCLSNFITVYTVIGWRTGRGKLTFNKTL